MAKYNKTGNPIIGNNIKMYRVQAHLTQEQFGKLVNYHKSSIGKIETAVVDVSTDSLELFAKVLGVTVADLLKGTCGENLRTEKQNERLSEFSVYLPYLMECPEAVLKTVRKLIGMPETILKGRK